MIEINWTAIRTFERLAMPELEANEQAYECELEMGHREFGSEEAHRAYSEDYNAILTKYANIMFRRNHREINRYHNISNTGIIT